MDMKFNEVTNGERSRTYVFPDGKELKVESVKRVHVRPSGGHRLETVGGEKYIVASGWLAIRVDADEWSF